MVSVCTRSASEEGEEKRERTLARGGLARAELVQVHAEDVAQDLLHLGEERVEVPAAAVGEDCGAWGTGAIVGVSRRALERGDKGRDEGGAEGERTVLDDVFALEDAPV